MCLPASQFYWNTLTELVQQCKSQYSKWSGGHERGIVLAFQGGNLKFGTFPLQRKYRNSSVVFQQHKAAVWLSPRFTVSQCCRETSSMRRAEYVRQACRTLQFLNFYKKLQEYKFERMCSEWICAISPLMSYIRTSIQDFYFYLFILGQWNVSSVWDMTCVFSQGSSSSAWHWLQLLLCSSLLLLLQLAVRSHEMSPCDPCDARCHVGDM